MTGDLKTRLRDVFGFADFRGVQEQVIGRVMAGQPTLAVMPTGASKSLCYQLPALAREGTALVITGDVARVVGSSLVGIYDQGGWNVPVPFRWLEKGDLYDLARREPVRRAEEDGGSDGSARGGPGGPGGG